MKSTCTFICGIHNIEVDEDLGEGLILIPHEQNEELPTIRLTNNKDKIKSLLTNQLLHFVGAIEYSHLENGYPMIAYAESEFELDEVHSVEHLDFHLYFLKMYFFCLWLTKDNSADFDVGFLQFTNSKGEPEVSSNNMTNSNFNISGSRTPCKFTIDELNIAAEYLTQSIQIEHKERPKLAIASSLDKVSIANYFIQSAIVSHDLGIKAVGYCSALETLFSNGDNTELSHRLSERISKFLETDLEKRKTLYKTIKKIYEIRSKVVHGATYKAQKTEELSALVNEADVICRRIMIYAFTTSEDENIFDKSRDDLDSFFIDLILK